MMKPSRKELIEDVLYLIVTDYGSSWIGFWDKYWDRFENNIDDDYYIGYDYITEIYKLDDVLKIIRDKNGY